MVFFDAGGTLFRSRVSIGAIYSGIARDHGVDLDGVALDGAFVAAFRRQAPLAFAGLRGGALDAAERAWWRRLVEEVVGARISGAAFGRYFDDVYRFFSRGDAWHLFEDVVPELERLARSGCRLGVVSNFDSRLDDVLVALGIARHFEHVIVSSRAGAAKPDPRIFRAALACFGVEPERAWHVGDVAEDDVAGATASGIRPILLDRHATQPRHRGARITTLEDLACWIP